MSRGGASRPGPAPGGMTAGLLLWPPAAPLGAGFAGELAAVLATGAVAAFVVPAGDAAGAWRSARDACRAVGTAFLVEGDLDLADALAADGVQLADPAAVPAARKRLGQRGLLGAACGHSRHAAMLAGEEGADYLLFAPGEVAGRAVAGEDDAAGDGDDPEAAAEDDPPRTMCAWWTELFLPPCAVDLRGAGTLPDTAALAGADLVAVDAAVWGHADGPAAGARELARLLGEARRAAG